MTTQKEIEDMHIKAKLKQLKEITSEIENSDWMKNKFTTVDGKLKFVTEEDKK